MKIVKIIAKNLQTKIIAYDDVNDFNTQLQQYIFDIIEHEYNILIENLMLCDDNDVSNDMIYDIMQNDIEKIELLYHFFDKNQRTLTFIEMQLLLKKHYTNFEIINMTNNNKIDYQHQIAKC